MRLRYQPTRQGTSPEYPPAGALIDYVVGSAGGVVKLDILDGAGTVVRSFASNANLASTGPAEQGMRGPPQPAPTTRRALCGPRAPSVHLGPPRPGTRQRGGAGSGPGSPWWRLGATRSGSPSGTGRPTRAVSVRADPRVTADGVTDAVLAEQAALGPPGAGSRVGGQPDHRPAPGPEAQPPQRPAATRRSPTPSVSS